MKCIIFVTDAATNDTDEFDDGDDDNDDYNDACDFNVKDASKKKREQLCSSNSKVIFVL